MVIVLWPRAIRSRFRESNQLRMPLISSIIWPKITVRASHSRTKSNLLVILTAIRRSLLDEILIGPMVWKMLSKKHSL